MRNKALTILLAAAMTLSSAACSSPTTGNESPLNDSDEASITEVKKEHLQEPLLIG